MVVKVKGWLKLTPEQREECIMKLRYEVPSHLMEGFSTVMLIGEYCFRKGSNASEGRDARF